MTGHRGHWLQTYSGIAYYPTHPLPGEVSLIDIAHHLSMLCRFTGAGKRFYSVAEHSVHVSRLVPHRDAMAGLLHDATEAYVGDINRPLKHSPEMQGYREIEQRNWEAIAECFGLPQALPASVHAADDEMLHHERAAMMGDVPGLEWGMGASAPEVLKPEMIQNWSPERAKSEFLKRYEELR